MYNLIFLPSSPMPHSHYKRCLFPVIRSDPAVDNTTLMTLQMGVGARTFAMVPMERVCTEPSEAVSPMEGVNMSYTVPVHV